MAVPAPNQSQDQDQDFSQHNDVMKKSTNQQPSISQTSLFRVLPSELILHIFSQLDIVTIFRFLDTCRYHRYLLLNMPDVWRKVLFLPLSEYANLSSSAASFTPLSVAAAATATPLETTSQNKASNGSATISSPNSQFTGVYHKRAQRSLRSKDSSSGSGSDTDDSNESASKGANGTTNRLKHSENERDRERGGSTSLISEIYAVLRRFRKENRLVHYVREIYMDSTDSPQFPSPLVMLIKFPHLQVLSSRYRRKQTSLTTDAHTLKDMLRNGDILPHSLELRRWDIFNPYMTKEDVTGFKQILDAISIVGGEMSSDQENNKDRDGETRQQKASNLESNLSKLSSRESSGVLLDIRMCPGPLPVSSDIDGTGETVAQSTPLSAGGMHWATNSSVHTPPTPAVPATVLPGPSLPCGNIVWVLEKCRTALERQRTRQTSGGVGSSATATSTSSQTIPRRPLTPPGSISLSQMRDLSRGVNSAYITPQSATQAAVSSQPVLTRPPEFSLFD
ncbi:hypothetical protein BGZ49_001860 [Haplosporangium sp. Z 27]|nr:hypothetical protein BGZ49_001860 [Haplosporangium sp. Z 27]